MSDEKIIQDNNEIEIEKNLENEGEEKIEEDITEFEFDEDPEGKQASYGAGGEEDPELKSKFAKLKAELKQAKKEKEEYLTGWQKERANFVNYKKEENDRRKLFSETIEENILSKFLLIIDSFNIAFQNKEAWEKVDENWRKGIEYIYGQMNTIFEEYGVKSIGEEDEIFNPNIHESIELIETKIKDDDHKIAEVIQKGYKLGDPSTGGGQGRILRPARVKVFEYKE